MLIPSSPSSNSNRILSALSSEDYRRFTQLAKPMALPVGEILYRANEPIPDIYFILDGMASIVATMEEGTTIEVMVVGREGMVGLPALDSPEAVVPTTAFMQVDGHGIKFSAAELRKEFSRGGLLQAGLLKYLQFSLVQIAQSAACNRLHNLEERLSRWLLMVHDRVQSSEFGLTHEFIAQMLGTRRSSVTLAAGMLQRAGLVTYHRGRIAILDREGLESTACECYPIIKASWDRFLANT